MAVENAIRELDSCEYETCKYCNRRVLTGLMWGHYGQCDIASAVYPERGSAPAGGAVYIPVALVFPEKAKCTCG